MYKINTGAIIDNNINSYCKEGYGTYKYGKKE